MRDAVHELVARLRNGTSAHPYRGKPASEPAGGVTNQFRRELALALEEIDQRLAVIESRLDERSAKN